MDHEQLVQPMPGEQLRQWPDRDLIPITTPLKNVPATYDGPTYYDMPALKHSHYRWLTAVSFFAEGIGGFAQITATLADLIGGGKDRSLVRAGRYLALAGSSISPGTLISALHTRKRWYNMLRIFRPTSPMSIGVWSLSGLGLLSGAAAAGQLAEDLGWQKTGRGLARAAGIPAAVAGGVVSAYTGTELEETQMPLWVSAYPLMSPLLASVAACNGFAALSLMPVSKDAARRLDTMAMTAESLQLSLAAITFLRWRNHASAASFQHSRHEKMVLAGILSGAAFPLALRLLSASTGKSHPVVRWMAGLSGLAGGLTFLLGIIYAGRESGKHAADYLSLTSEPVRKSREDEHTGISDIEAASLRQPVRPGRGKKLLFGLLAAGAGFAVCAMFKRR